MSDESAETRALAKLRTFIREGLEPDERVVVASLLAPAVAQAFDGGEPEVEGFGVVEWKPTLPEALADSIRTSGMKVVLDDDA
jgi:hypothetical protein